MTETFKSLLLLLLVTLSLVLTYQLWYGEKPAELTADDVYERVVVETPRPMEKLITPEQIIIENDNNSYLFRKNQDTYSNLWAELSGLLQDLEQDDIFTEWSIPDDGVSNLVRFYFDPALPIGEDMPWLPYTTSLEVEEIKLYSVETVDDNAGEENHEDEEENENAVIENNNQVDENDEVDEDGKAAEEDEKEVPAEEKEWFLVLKKSENNSARSLAINGENIEGIVHVLNQVTDDNNEVSFTKVGSDFLEEKIGREIEVRSSIYVPNDIISMDTLEVIPENLDRERLLKTFFVDYNLVRTIEEGDGSFIYTDGGKGLRISETGIEYSDPRKEEGNSTLNYREALRNCGRLISYHGGWPDNLRLEELVFSSRGGYSYYDSEWLMYHEGYPVHVEKPTRALFNDLGLVNYTRSLFFTRKTPINNDDGEGKQAFDDEEKHNIADWDKALIKAITIYDAGYPVRRPRLNLDAMELGYVITGTPDSFKALPVWLIQLDGEKIYLSAENLEQVAEEDIF